MTPSVDTDRIRRRNGNPDGSGPALYWMQRDMRATDNWALLFAREWAERRRVPLAVVFCLDASYPGATSEHFVHLILGLQDVALDLAALRIPFFLREGSPSDEVARLARDCDAGAVIADFLPLRHKEAWMRALADKLAVPLYEVDAHNVVPAWVASPKKEYSAATLRPKIHRLLHRFLVPFPRMEPMESPWRGPEESRSPDMLLARFGGGGRFPKPAYPPGARRALERLERFAVGTLARYGTDRNDPTKSALSGLSPAFHFGHLAPQRAALRIREAEVPQEAGEAYLEELIVRRELADNFCLHERDYDRWEGLPGWARSTLEKHAGDPRPQIYDEHVLENALTHDGVWNAAQREMRVFGKMHGYLRMYWGKKILEWSATPQDALMRALRMNDRYELDGRDPNGYAGVAWAIGGLHDRPWPERPVYGTVRSMTASGLRRKFDAEAYARSIPPLASE